MEKKNLLFQSPKTQALDPVVMTVVRCAVRSSHALTAMYTPDPPTVPEGSTHGTVKLTTRVSGGEQTPEVKA